MRISDWSSDVCSSDLAGKGIERQGARSGGALPPDERGARRAPELAGGYECAWHVAVGRAHGQLSIPAGQGRGVPRGLLGRAQGDGLARRQSPAVILNESRSIRRVRAPSWNRKSLVS